MFEARRDTQIRGLFEGTDFVRFETMPTVPRPQPSASLPGQESATRGRIARWQEETLSANLAFEADRDVQARRSYEEALAIADQVLESATLGDREAARAGLLLFGASCNHIVALARRQRDIETEGIFLYRAVDRFIALTASARAPLRFRSRCLLHLKVASDALYRYFERRAMWDAAAAYSESANAAMFEVQRLEAAARQRARTARSAARRGYPPG
jgi:hypothetical protein